MHWLANRIENFFTEDMMVELLRRGLRPHIQRQDPTPLIKAFLVQIQATPKFTAKK